MVKSVVSSVSIWVIVKISVGIRTNVWFKVLEVNVVIESAPNLFRYIPFRVFYFVVRNIYRGKWDTKMTKYLKVCGMYICEKNWEIDWMKEVQVNTATALTATSASTFTAMP